MSQDGVLGVLVVQAGKTQDWRASVRTQLRLSLRGFWFPNQGRVPHISLVFREMWDFTGLSL
jgi:hypothetical protein